jgi:hypothetical protein
MLGRGFLITPESPMLEPSERPSRGDHVAPFEAYNRFLKKARRELRRTAYHEAGHAVAAVVRRIDIEDVAVNPTLSGDLHEDLWDALGEVRGGPVFSCFEAEHVWADHLVYTLAGPAAEMRYAGLARWPLDRLDGDGKQVRQLLAISRLDFRHTLNDYQTLALLLVDGHWHQVEAVAASLIERRFLTAREVRRVIRSARP